MIFEIGHDKMITVERIGDSFAVCELEDGSHVNIDLAALPSQTREGSVIVFDDRGEMVLDTQAERSRRKQLFDKQSKLFNK